MPKKLMLERKEQLDLNTLNEILMDVEYIYHLQQETNEMYKKVAKRIREFRGTHFDLYENILTQTQTRLYFGSEFYPYFALNELQRLRTELRQVASIIEEVMIKTDPKE